MDREFSRGASKRLRLAVALLAVGTGAAWGSFAAGQARADALRALAGASPATDGIELVAQTRLGRYWIDFFRNGAYTCGLGGGYQTFVVASPVDTGPGARRPLYVRLHGGGTGAWADDGSYHPAMFFPGRLDQEPMLGLTTSMFDRGLVADARDDVAGFRFLIPSMCDHDLYSGVGLPDPHNPYSPDLNGRPRTTDGLLATVAALQYTRAHYVTSTTVAHGTSAGSAGAFSLAYAEERLGAPLAGIVMDSGVADDRMRTIARVAGWQCVSWLGDFNYDAVAARAGPLMQPGNMPKSIVGRGEFHTPIMLVWNPGDPSFCGTIPIPHIDPGGRPHTLYGTDFMNEPLAETIALHNPGGHSESYRLCVTYRMARYLVPPCNKHTPTGIAYWEATPPGDSFNGGRDYNRYIMSWLDARLGDGTSDGRATERHGSVSDFPGQLD